MGTLEDRLAKNEVIFRKYNESIEKGFEKLKKIAKEQGWQESVEQSDDKLYFFCECSDATCQKRILVKPSRYNKIHQNRSQFVIVCGHEVADIEEVLVAKEKGYCVVRKFKIPPESTEELSLI